MSTLLSTHEPKSPIKQNNFPTSNHKDRHENSAFIRTCSSLQRNLFPTLVNNTNKGYSGKIFSPSHSPHSSPPLTATTYKPIDEDHLTGFKLQGYSPFESVNESEISTPLYVTMGYSGQNCEQQWTHAGISWLDWLSNYLELLQKNNMALPIYPLPYEKKSLQCVHDLTSFLSIIKEHNAVEFTHNAIGYLQHRGSIQESKIKISIFVGYEFVNDRQKQSKRLTSDDINELDRLLEKYKIK